MAGLINIFIVTIIAPIFIYSSFLFAAESLIETKIQATSQKPDKAQARQEMLDQAIATVTNQYVQELIGTQKFEHNANLIKSKLAKNSAKFILFMKESNAQYSAQQSSMTVEMKVSIKNLESTLREDGLLSTSEGPPRILPVIGFVDHPHSQAYRWWTQSRDVQNLKEMGGIFFDRLNKELKNVGFAGLNPSTGLYDRLLPSGLHAESPVGDAYLQMAEYFQASIVIRGELNIEENKDKPKSFRLEFKLTALHSANGRVIGEVVRSFETDSGLENVVVLKKLNEVSASVASDLSAQLSEAWRSGSFGATLIKLTLKGNLDYSQIVNFKKTVNDSLKQVRVLKERGFGPGEAVFEIDSSSPIDQLAKDLEQKTYGNFKLLIQTKTSDSLIFNIKRL